jgi:hypothetical protein
MITESGKTFAAQHNLLRHGKSAAWAAAMVLATTNGNEARIATSIAMRASPDHSMTAAEILSALSQALPDPR